MNFRPRLLDTLPGYSAAAFAKDLGADITVGIVALPLAIASGLPPASGLWAAIVGGFVVALLGGSNVLIARPAPPTPRLECGVGRDIYLDSSI